MNAEESMIIDTSSSGTPDEHESKALSEQPQGSKAAMEFSFELDPWQKQAVQCLEDNESVLVAAHTSAGKTVVAEYAVALALNKKQRVIFTAPVKALSNQKYRELKQRFDDVGLMTGDINLSPSASCLVMTTEILRNMLYRGASELQEVAWVIFDEIHYMRDRERGVVWEEAIILLPKHTRLVFLSATLSNADQFAAWITHLRSDPCHVVQTEKRPTPLHHYAYVKGFGDGLYLLAESTTSFDHGNFQVALERAAEQKRNAIASAATKSDINRLVSVLVSQHYEPAIVFSFSRRVCEANATQMGGLDFLDASEKEMVQEVFDNALESLSVEDRKLPQLHHILPLLLRGIGVHHSGLLPIIKELVELLFQESLIKILFATETFSIGVNMPAKTVVFTETEKFDGSVVRQLRTSEYIQMSGRAGRRNCDAFGLSVIMVTPNTEASELEQMLQGKPFPLVSRFRLSYSMVLNLLRSEVYNPEDILKLSFRNFQDMQTKLQDQTRAEELQKELDAVLAAYPFPLEPVEAAFQLRSALDDQKQRMRSLRMKPDACLKFLQAGRVVHVALHESTELRRPFRLNACEGYGWGVVLDTFKDFSPDRYAVDVLIRSQNPPAPSKKHEDVEVVRFSLSMIDEISSVRVYVPDDLSVAPLRVSLMETVDALIANGMPLLDEVAEADKEESGTLRARIEGLQHRLDALQVKDEAWQGYEAIHELRTKLSLLKKQRDATELDRFRAELKNRIRLLRRLDYVDANDVVLQKGQLACELEALDEIVTTELIFDGVFTDLNPAESAALVACMLDVRCRDQVTIPKRLAEPIEKMRKLAKRVVEVSRECNLEINEEVYLAQFSAVLASVVHDWCSGKSFMDVCSSTTVFEGNIIRNLRRLDELLVQLASGAQTIGNEQLCNKFEEARKALHRGVPFAGSLYLE